MKHETQLGLVCNVVGVLVALTAFGWPLWLAGLTLPMVGLSALGWWWIRKEAYTRGAWTLIVSSALLLPVGAVGVYAGLQTRQYQKYGVHLGGGPRPEVVPRPRAWTLAATLFALVGLGAAVVALTQLRTSHVTEMTQLIALISACLLAAVCAVEAALLWGNRDSARRLGAGLCVSSAAALALGGFYLHSYLAVALLGLPVYGLMLVLQGRSRWRGMATSSSGARSI